MSENTETNRAHWNEAASTYNNRFSKTIQQIIEEIQKRREWIGVDWVDDASSDGEESSPPKKAVRLLDYACGTGLVSRALAPYVTECIGIDLSEGMVNEYNASVQNQGIPASEMRAVLGNLIDASDPNPAALSGPEFHDFDIAVVGLGFHHFDDPALAAQRLAERLKKGGVLMIVDFMPHGHFHGHDGHGHGGHGHGGHGHGGHGHEHPAQKTVMHMGFSEEEIKRIFEGTDVGGGFDFVLLGKGVVFEDREKGTKMERNVFMARGSKL